PAAGIIDHLDQVYLLATALEPVMFAGIPLHQLTVPLAALPPHMHLFDAFSANGSQSSPYHPLPHCLLAGYDRMLACQILACQRGSKIPVHLLTEDLDRFLLLRCADLMVGTPATQPVDNRAVTFGLQRCQHTVYLSLAYLQFRGCR